MDLNDPIESESKSKNSTPDVQPIEFNILGKTIVALIIIILVMSVVKLGQVWFL